MPNLSQLYEAIQKNQLSEVLRLINENNSFINEETEDGLTPLTYAIEEDKNDIVDFLLKEGADPYYVNQNGTSAFFMSCKEARTNYLTSILEYSQKKINVDTKNELGWTGLETIFVKHLSDKAWNKDTKSGIEENIEQFIEYLIKAGASFDPLKSFKPIECITNILKAMLKLYEATTDLAHDQWRKIKDTPAWEQYQKIWINLDPQEDLVLQRLKEWIVVEIFPDFQYDFEFIESNFRNEPIKLLKACIEGYENYIEGIKEKISAILQEEFSNSSIEDEKIILQKTKQEDFHCFIVTNLPSQKSWHNISLPLKFTRQTEILFKRFEISPIYPTALEENKVFLSENLKEEIKQYLVPLLENNPYLEAGQTIQNCLTNLSNTIVQFQEEYTHAVSYKVF